MTERRPASGAGPAPAAGTVLLELVAIMDRLRTECPWDRKQTHQSLARYLVEETYEALEAIEAGDLAALREELGDVLLQVIFHARIAAERIDGSGFTIEDVAAGIAEKLVRRHPHVFGGTSVSGAEEVTQNWDTIKAAERAAAGGGEASVFDGIPMGQPALPLAGQLLSRATRASVPAALADLSAPDAASGQASEIGAELFALVARARTAGLDPELELRHAARVYRDRVQNWERGAGSAPA